MRKIIILFGLIYLMAISACEEKDPFPDLNIGIIPTIQFGSSDGRSFNLADVNNSSVSFTLGYNNFGGKLRAGTIDIRVASAATIDGALNYNGSVPLKSVTGFPAPVTITLQEVCTALGLNINTVANNRSIEIFLVLTTEDGTVYREGADLNAGVIAANTLGYFRYRFFTGCVTPVEDGYYKATISGTNPFNVTGEKEVIISRQKVTLEGAAAFLNFLPDIFSITDISGGLYPKTGLPGNLISNQPVGIRNVCGAFALYNNALLTLPSPASQVAFGITGGSWDPATKTLVLTWTDAANGVTETTTFVKQRDL